MTIYQNQQLNSLNFNNSLLLLLLFIDKLVLMRLFIIIICAVLVGCTFPRDPENSYEEAKKSTLRIGLVKNPPYVITQGEEPSGSEVRMLRNFAKKEGLQIEFMAGSETQLINKLHKFDLHIVAGGFDKKTLWKKKAGLSAPYDGKHIFLIPKGENRLLEHLERFIFNQKKKG